MARRRGQILSRTSRGADWKRDWGGGARRRSARRRAAPISGRAGAMSQAHKIDGRARVYAPLDSVALSPSASRPAACRPARPGAWGAARECTRRAHSCASAWGAGADRRADGCEIIQKWARREAGCWQIVPSQGGCANSCAPHPTSSSGARPHRVRTSLVGNLRKRPPAQVVAPRRPTNWGAVEPVWWFKNQSYEPTTRQFRARAQRPRQLCAHPIGLRREEAANRLILNLNSSLRERRRC